ncbi:V-type ATP synthase subunit F [Nanoarchaeota archaeon]
MVEIVIAGHEEFLLGFKLSGVRHTFNTEENAKEIIEKVIRMGNVGVLVIP